MATEVHPVADSAGNERSCPNCGEQRLAGSARCRRCGDATPLERCVEFIDAGSARANLALTAPPSANAFQRYVGDAFRAGVVYPTRDKHLAFTFYAAASQPFDQLRAWGQTNPWYALNAVHPDALVRALQAGVAAIAREALVVDDRQVLALIPAGEIETIARALGPTHAELGALLQEALQRGNVANVLGKIIGLAGQHFLGLDGSGVSDDIGALAGGGLRSLLAPTEGGATEGLLYRQLHFYAASLVIAANKLESDSWLRSEYARAQQLRQLTRVMDLTATVIVFGAAPLLQYRGGLAMLVCLALAPFLTTLIRRRYAGYWSTPSYGWCFVACVWLAGWWMRPHVASLFDTTDAGPATTTTPEP